MKKTIIIVLSILIVAFALTGALYYNGYFDMDTYEYEADFYRFEDGWVYTVYDNTAEIDSCLRVAGTVLDIPETLGGYPVTGLSWSIINDKQAKRISEINIPDTLKYFRKANFSSTRWYKNQPDGVVYLGNIAIGLKGDTADSRLIIKEGTTVIAGNAFSDENALEEVVFPSTLEIIGYDAFRSCDNLKKINIPESVKEINSCAFQDCAVLEFIETDNAATEINSSAFWGTCWYSQQNADFVTLCGNLLAYTKYDNNGQDIYIEEGIIRIGDFAFETCENIGMVHIPEMCTEISEWAFQDASFKGFVVNEKNTAYMSDENGNLYSKDKAQLIRYAALNENKEFTVPESVTYIADEAFSNAAYLEIINIHAGVEHIGADAFYKTTALKNISVSPDNGFYKSIDGVLFDKRGALLISYTNGSDSKSYTIPDGVTEVDDWAFAYCEHIEEIVIPDSVERIGSILRCKSLNKSGLVTDREEFASDVFLQECGFEYSEE